MIDIEKMTGLFRYNSEMPMLFNSGLFLFLFPAFVWFYYLLRGQARWRTFYVLAFSYFFYYKSSGVFFLLLFFTSLFDYWMGAAIYRSREQWKRRVYVAVSVVVNLGMLGYFKYANFFREMWCDITGAEFLSMSIILPVGISFFTFQSMSYTIDVYRRQLEPLQRFTDYAFFVSFFPQLVAGPIVRAHDFIPQMLAKVVVTKEMFGRGVFLIAIGLFKKAVISDYISINFVDRIFDTPKLFSGVENLMAVYGYALQIYCDFSGYSDMAIGIALLLGFRFKMNFNAPYKSQSITEFWQRWHISLSTWLRDYLYIPLGGNRKGMWRTYANLMTTMILGGLWHGASLRFVFWGAWHGFLLTIERIARHLRQSRQPSADSGDEISQPVEMHPNMLQRMWIVWQKQYWTKRVVCTLITFHLVCFAWIFFRANSFATAWEMIHRIFSNFQGHLFLQWVVGYSSVVMLMVLGYVTHFLPDSLDNFVSQKVIASPLVVKVGLLVAVIIVVMQVKSSDILPFIYFQF